MSLPTWIHPFYFLPIMDVRRMGLMLRRWEDHSETYAALSDELIADGWAPADVWTLSPKTTHGLAEAFANQGLNFDTIFGPGWMPYQEASESGWGASYLASLGYPGPAFLFNWRFSVTGAFVPGDDGDVVVWESFVILRVLYRMFQLRVALATRNAFCLDNRGRPDEEEA